jgi:hypothetical protein
MADPEITLEDILHAVKELTKSMTDMVKEMKAFKELYEKHSKAGKF